MPGDSESRITDFIVWHWVAGYVSCIGLLVSTFFADQETFYGLIAWLAWFFPTTITCGVALLIASVWRPARLFTGIALIITSVISFCALVIAIGSMLHLTMRSGITFLLMCVLPPAPFFMVLIGIVASLTEGTTWKMFGIILGWTVTTIMFAKVGELIRISGTKWLKAFKERRQKANRLRLRRQIQTIFQD